MGDKTGISWTDATWNPIRGCSRVSEGCRNCYAERVAARFSGEGQPYEGLVRVKTTIANNEERDPGNRREARWNGTVRMVPEHLADPLHWKRPRRIFVNSMSDPFHETLTNEQIAAVFGVMAMCPQHTFQILTKRARRMREWFAWADGGPKTPHPRDVIESHARAALDGIEEGTPVRREARWPLPNVWLGVSVENQHAADERIPELLATPAALRFLSCEPLIGEEVLLPAIVAFGSAVWAGPKVDWVIAGCESGPGARPCSVEWLRSLRDQCAGAGVAFFLKQATETVESVLQGDGSKRKPGGVIELPYLDGVQHVAFPEVTP